MGCGSRGSVDWTPVCKPQTMACLSTQVGQICNDQGEWATFQCSANQECQAGACVAAGGPCSPGTTQCLGSQVAQVCAKNGQWETFVCPLGQACLDTVCAAAAGPCTNGSTQCLSPRVGQICSQQQWITFECAGDQTCRNNACVDADPHACSPNAHECVSSRIQRICLADGTGWITSDCPDGLKCENGECVGACTPGNKSCAAHSIVRECRTDGAGYTDQPCPSDRMCDAGTCVPDPSILCSNTEYSYGVCQDDRTLTRCKLDGSGYESTPCSEGTTCEGGQCRGPVCAAGETSCSSSDVSNLVAVQTCNDDGSGYTLSVCRAHEQCALNAKKARYECYEPPCTKGDTRCGDSNSSVSDTAHLSRCEPLAEGRVAWVSYLCSAPSACTVDDWGTAVCHADCAPGDQRCASDENAIETCGEDGKWSKQDCEPSDGATPTCLVIPTNQHVVCGDPDCANLQYSKEDYKTRGRCSESQIRRCNEDGLLAAATECEEGTCLPDGAGFGVCKDPSRCEQTDGWRECVTGDDAFRTCNSNFWEFTPCAADQVCADDGLGHAACGGDCIPDSRRCDGPKYQVCAADGTWGPSTACSTGECNPITMRCEVACEPGEIRCAGNVAVASDGSSLGASGMQTCQADGRWGALESCNVSAGQSCRRSVNGVSLGCVECVGDAPGGNEEGARDYRCTANATGWQACEDDNTWPTTAVSCGAQETCVKRRDGSLTGSCTDDGCSSGYSRRCVGYKSLETPEIISDCCAGACNAETGQCTRRQSDYDATCVETTSCFTGRYDEDSNAIYETCCSGFCKYGQGCLRPQGEACTSVAKCEVKTLGIATVCCGTCQADGSCPSGQEAEHPIGEYFSCGNSSSLCWNVGSCTWSPSGSASGAMYATCKADE